MRRVAERALAAILLVALSPLIVVIAATIWVRLGPPVIFRQTRAGLGGQPFELVKFRSMTDGRNPATGDLLPDRERLTLLGRWLRSTSLDELPELWNIIVGDMTFVGPRPLPMEYLDRYTERERRRHDVLPGLTGWAQVNGRNAVGWDERLELDVWYVEHQSLHLDVRILLRTVGAVLRREGISAHDSETMHELRPDPG